MGLSPGTVSPYYQSDATNNESFLRSSEGRERDRLTNSSDLDELSTFESLSSRFFAPNAPTRYAVRQVLDQELQRVILERDHAARQARFQAGRPTNPDHIPTISDDKENSSKVAKTAVPSLPGPKLKRDFFGRVIAEVKPLGERSSNATNNVPEDKSRVQVWVKYHEGFNNAVRKPISLQDFLQGL
jgi:chromosome transmission fidelity protein 18